MKVLFIGLGSIGQRHLRNLRYISGYSIDVIAFRSKNQSPVLDEQQQIIKNTDLDGIFDGIVTTAVKTYFWNGGTGQTAAGAAETVG